MIRLSTDRPVTVYIHGGGEGYEIDAGWSHDDHGISGRFTGDHSAVYVPMTAVLLLNGTHIDDLPPGVGDNF